MNGPRFANLRTGGNMPRKRTGLATTPVHLLDPGNPNHPINDGIFGYETKAFLARQY